ncbi:metallophosphoesterase [Intestinibacter sp.]
MNSKKINYLKGDDEINNIEFIVATDLHYISPRADVDGELIELCVAKGDLKQMKYASEIIDVLVDEVIRYKPSGGLIICGDLTYNGEKVSHVDLMIKLQRVIDKGINIYVIPGNHDIKNYNAYKYKATQKIPIKSVSPKIFKEIYFNCGYRQAIYKDDYSISYIAQVSDDLWLAMFDTNLYQNNNWKNPVAIKGVLSDSTYEWLEEHLKEAKEKNIKVIAVTHHSLVDHNDLLNKGYTLEDNQRLVELYAKYDVALNLSGHLHIQHIKPGYSKTVKNRKVYDIATSSLVVCRNQYAVLKYEPKKSIYYKTKVLDVSRWAFKKGILDNNLLHFNYYSYNFAYSQTYKKIYYELLKRDLSEYEARMMSSTLSKLNPAFFSGTVVEIYRIIEVSDNYKIWSLVSDIFYHKYIDSIMKEKKYDHNTLRLSLREDDGSFGEVIWNKNKG